MIEIKQKLIERDMKRVFKFIEQWYCPIAAGGAGLSFFFGTQYLYAMGALFGIVCLTEIQLIVQSKRVKIAQAIAAEYLKQVKIGEERVGIVLEQVQVQRRILDIKLKEITKLVKAHEIVLKQLNGPRLKAAKYQVSKEENRPPK